MANIVILITTAVAALASPPPAAVPSIQSSSGNTGSAAPGLGQPSGPDSRERPALPVLACIRRWESATKGLYRAISPGGLYRGAYQFDWPTWLGVGGSGDPALATPAEQDYRAGLLVGLRGLAPWPTPARMCA